MEFFRRGCGWGRVVELRDAGGRLTRIAVLEPAVDLGQLEQVFVMLRRGPTMDLLYRANRAEDDLDGPIDVSGRPPKATADGDETVAAENGS